MSDNNNYNRIVKLDEIVINRIAAGEVVQRPSAALKEMLENSLDAGATSISVIAKGGGMNLMQITDNGHGISKDDLEIACARFTTSKLSTYEDLQTISTFGFRGEALASITHVAHVTILTKTKGSPCAYKAKYCDGKLIPLKPDDKAEPKPAAGMIGTTITVEDLFYNMPTRRQAFKNANEEYQRILEVITKYSIHFGDKKVGFTCKKYGQNVPDLHTPVNATSSAIDCIKIAYGGAIARELIPFSFSTYDINAEYNAKKPNKLLVTVQGKVTNANYSNKRSVFILFINNRLVESASIKRTIESVYNEVLPKHSYPFIYLSIHMPPQHIDVNVHPTKKEVHFLFEDELLGRIHSELSATLAAANESRSFHVQTTLTSHHTPLALPQDTRKDTALICDEDNKDLNNEEDDLQQMDESGRLTSDSRQDSGFIRISHSDSTKANISNDMKTIGSKRASSVSSGFGSAKAAPNKLVRTDPSLVKINSFFSKATDMKYSSTTVDTLEGSGSLSSLLSGADSESDPLAIKDRNHVPIDQTSGGRGEEADDRPFNFLCKKRDSNLAGDSGGLMASCLCCADNNNAGSNPAIRGVPAPSESNETVSTSISSKLVVAFEDTPCEYVSVRNLLAAIYNSRSTNIESVLKNHTFVGAVSSSQSLIQCGTKLLPVQHSLLAW